MTRTHNVALVSNPGTKLVIPEPEGSRFPTAQVVVALVASLGGGWWTMSALEHQGRDDPRLEIAANVVRLTVDNLKHGLLSHVRVMCDDARIRTTLATDEIDRATIEDVLQDLLQAGELSGVAVFDVRGKAVALAGRADLAEVDLSATSLVDADGGTGVWALGEDVLVVASAPISLGAARWTLLGARKLDVQSVERIRDAVGTTLGIASEGKVLIAVPLSNGHAEVLQAGTRAPLGMTLAGPHSLFVRELETGPRASLVIAVAENHDARTAQLIWLPLALLIASGIASVLLALRR